MTVAEAPKVPQRLAIGGNRRLAIVLSAAREAPFKGSSFVLPAFVVAAPALAQGMREAPTAGMVGALKASFDAVGGYIVRSAEVQASSPRVSGGPCKGWP